MPFLFRRKSLPMQNTRRGLHHEPNHKLVDTLDAQHYLTFYKIMHYPIPKEMEAFSVEKKF
jgi:hypothetical protein